MVGTTRQISDERFHRRANTLSNNYIHVAFTFDAGTPENAIAVRDSLRELYVEVEQDGRVLTLTSEEADLELLIDLLWHAIQSMPDIPAPQGFEWAFSADKHRVGDFGGGAVVIGREAWPPRLVDTASWLKDALAASDMLS